MAAGQQFAVGDVIQSETDPNDYKIWTGKNWGPAAKDPGSGKWALDQGAMAAATGVAPKAAAAPRKSAEDIAALKDLGKHVQQSNLLAERANKFMDLQGAGRTGVATGPAMGLPVVGDIARGITNLTDRDAAARLQQMDAINNQTWTMLRPEGSGPIRAFEATGWKKAFPYAGNFPQANEGLRKQYVGEANEARRHLQFVTNFIESGQGGNGAAEAAYALQKANPPAPGGSPPAARGAPAPGAPAPAGKPLSAPDNYSRGWSSTLPPKQLAASKLYAGSKAPPGDKGNPYIPRNRGQFDKLPGGSWVLDDDGTVFQKRGG